MSDASEEGKAGGKEWLLLARRSQSRSRAFLHSFRSASSKGAALFARLKCQSLAINLHRYKGGKVTQDSIADRLAFKGSIGAEYHPFEPWEHTIALACTLSTVAAHASTAKWPSATHSCSVPRASASSRFSSDSVRRFFVATATIFGPLRPPLSTDKAIDATSRAHPHGTCTQRKGPAAECASTRSRTPGSCKIGALGLTDFTDASRCTQDRLSTM
ncbi:hypothetical protein BCV69DRAFT_156636 [Microstroma glucosiphilum]|uniref:Uncharacterized protein n=1 Tax=Pseudomicrostroma glucosiphilum TaxID=1684307 RepID=A0A316U9I0_9BASI|nr:hypothetical protein BCV69DRAFT_156636 [Pseudomicrostroma glucosiphilum]PWN21822.1 hypothetical protein BCV69DRAFT_156636 [Pseudomicrostroma glucosiphilum]